MLAPFALVAFCTSLLVDNINTAKSRIRGVVGSRRADRGSTTCARSRGIAEQEHDAANRAGASYSVLMVDIEHLKSSTTPTGTTPAIAP